jgi:hypothetical protein
MDRPSRLRFAKVIQDGVEHEMQIYSINMSDYVPSFVITRSREMVTALPISGRM